MHLREHGIFLILLPFGSNALYSQRTSVLEGCSDDQSSFFHWRHCELDGYSNNQREAGIHFREEETNGKPFSKTVLECVKDSAMSSPSPAQLTRDKSETQMSQILSSISPLSDMVYVICIKCDAVRVPLDFHNIVLVNGLASDQCLLQSDYGNSHYKRVLLAHKAAVAHAASEGRSNVTIIEEDVMINSKHEELPDFTVIADHMQMHLAEKDNQFLIRFTSLPWKLDGENGKCKKQGCRCHSITPELCYLPRGCNDIRDSSFYMVRSQMFGEYVKENRGLLDSEIFAAFDSVLVTPPITLQAHFECGSYKNGVYLGRQCGMADQHSSWQKYNDTCVVPASKALMCCIQRSSACCGPY
jgi:hypothetical protein